jgi:hypothetical protein
MSHYPVLVIGDHIEAQLQPYHEFECTGHADQYVIDVDETEAMLKTYGEQTVRKMKMPSGELLDARDDQFYRDPTIEELRKHGRKSDLTGEYKLVWSGTSRGISWVVKDWGDGRGERAKVYYIPEGCEVITVPIATEKTFLRFALDWAGLDESAILYEGERPDYLVAHKHGYLRVECQRGARQIEGLDPQIRCFKRTNPQAKWDWWTIGGRWTGFFKLRRGKTGTTGRPGVMGDQAKPGYVDQVRKGDIDLAGMQRRAVSQATRRYDAFAKAIKGLPWPETFEQIRGRYAEADIDPARDEYWHQPVLLAMKKVKAISWLDPFDFGQDRAAYIARAKRSALSTHALVKEGQWFEKGQMGWWGVVHNEQDRDAWNEQFMALVESLPDDTLFTVVDCHI